MSWGYVPKKLKMARRHKISRKKYKGFSCETCKERPQSYGTCYRLDWSRAFRGEDGRLQMKDCKYWRVSEEAKRALKEANVQQTPEKKQTRKGLFGRIFK